MSFMTGTPDRWERRDLLEKGQKPIKKQLFNAAQGRGAGGAFGESSDYWRDILSNDPETMRQFFAPEQRQFQEQTIPDLAEQFAGMGSGGLSSSGFQNAAVNAGTDLAERLGAIRANLRNQAAQGLQGLGQTSLTPFTQEHFRPGTPGFLESVAPGLAKAGINAAAGAVLGPAEPAAVNTLDNFSSRPATPQMARMVH